MCLMFIAPCTNAGSRVQYCFCNISGVVSFCAVCSSGVAQFESKQTHIYSYTDMPTRWYQSIVVCMFVSMNAWVYECLFIYVHVCADTARQRAAAAQVCRAHASTRAVCTCLVCEISCVHAIVCIHINLHAQPIQRRAAMGQWVAYTRSLR